MSLTATSTQSAYPDEFSDSMATMTADILQEQLAPILATLREHAKLLDLHAALLNHSTAMNRYNVGKLDDIRDLQVAVNYKMQFYIKPEDRQHPEYRSPIPLEPLPTTEPLPNVESRVQDSGPVPSSSSSSDEPTHQSPAVTSAAATTAASTSTSVRAPPDPLSTPTTTEPAAQSHPANPRQAQGDGLSVVPGPPRRPLERERPFSVPDPRQVQLAVVPAPPRRPLQRERPFSVAPDPMWNSSREINVHQPIAAPVPPPPYVNPPAYTPDDGTAPRVATPAATATSLSARTRSASPSSESTTSSSSESEVEQATLTSSRAAGKRRRTTADNARRGSPSSSAHSSAVSAAGRSSPAASENGDDDDPDTGLSSQLSEKARGKKRMRDEDGGEVDGPSVAGGSSGQASREGSAHKRMKGKEEWEDMSFDTEKLELDPAPTLLARMGIVERPSQEQIRYGAEKLRCMEKLFAGSRDSY